MRTLCLFAAYGVIALHAQTVTTLIDHGDPANRIDLLVLSEGYTAAELDKFAADAGKLMTAFFADEVYHEYAGYFNVRTVAVASNQSGASHPELNPPVVKDTAFAAAYNCSGVVRLICLGTAGVARMNMLLATIPANQRDYVFVLVNDPVYGGAGGSYFVSSTNSASFEVSLHESGHTIGLLVDEYGGPPPPACNLAVEPFAANATKETGRSLVKWGAWIAAATPLPTTTTTRGVPGLYQGADYCDNGMYRPTYVSKMRELNNPFESVNDEQLVRRFYNVVSGIDSSSPSTAAVTAVQGLPVEFRVTPMAPASHSLNVSWTIDGAAQPAGTKLTVDTSRLAVGSHTVEATVDDVTTWVRSDPSKLLTDTQKWQLTVTAGTPPRLTSLSVAPASIAAGSTARVTFAFTGPVVASGPLAMTISSSSPSLTVPATVALLAGQKSGTFDAQAAAAVTASVVGKISATYNGGALTTDFTLVPRPTPVIQGVAGAGQSVPAVLSLTTGGLLSIYGLNLGPDGVSRALTASDLVNGALPTNMAQTCVQIGNAMAPLTYVSSNQINAMAPVLPASGTVAVRVIANCGAPTATTSAAVNVPIASAAPEFLSFIARPDGKSPVAAIQSASGSYVGPAGLIPGAVFAPATAGDVLTIFGVGFGPTSSNDPPGTIATTAASTLSDATVAIGGVAAQVLYAGLTPTFAGLYQVNLIVPAGVPDGNQPIVIHVNGALSPPAAYLAIGH